MLAPCSRLRHSSIISFFSKTPSPFLYNTLSHASSSSSAHLKTLPTNKSSTFHLSSLSLSPTEAAEDKTHIPKSTKKDRKQHPASLLRFKLDLCSKKGDLKGALRLYDDARSRGISLSQYHYNVLLYLCSFASSPSSNAAEFAGGDSGPKRGFEIFRQMGIENIPPNEATFTSLARLAAAMEDPDLAFEMVKNMAGSGIPPRQRSYGPALFGFCRKGEAEKAYEVDDHMEASGVSAEEPELAALLQVSADAGRGERVYEMLHRLRAKVRQVSKSTAGIVERWFESEAAAKVGKVGWDVEKVKEGVEKGGGGWHGQGWLGKGKWKVGRTHMDETGVCGSCGEKLVCIDIDPSATENFAKSLSNLACKKEARAEFTAFQEWLVRHGPFEAVIDGANVGISNHKDFSFFQLNSVVKKVQQMSPSKKLPLIVLHDGRVWCGPAQDPSNKRLLQSWRRSGVLYTARSGSNDDWYWLYAAVSCNCLLVTNDKMRDHLFQLLGTSFFPQWKEKHQVRLTFSREGIVFQMPPPYSVVIQESQGGRWHVPIATSDDIEMNRQWICAARAHSACSTQFQPSVEQNKDVRTRLTQIFR